LIAGSLDQVEDENGSHDPARTEGQPPPILETARSYVDRWTVRQWAFQAQHSFSFSGKGSCQAGLDEKGLGVYDFDHRSKTFLRSLRSDSNGKQIQTEHHFHAFP